MSQKRLFVTATRDNDGKTVVTLGLCAAFREKITRLGFTKPFGLSRFAPAGMRLDPDAVLIESALSPNVGLQDMSPVAIDRDWTRGFMRLPREGRDQVKKELLDRVDGSFARASEGKDLVVIEGTGNPYVGYVYGLSNLEMAERLKASVLIVASGGVGQPLDEIAMDAHLYRQRGIPILGVIVNKMFPGEEELWDAYGREELRNLDLQLFGTIPQDPTLHAPTVLHVARRIGAEVLAGENLQVSVEKVVLASPQAADALAERLAPRSLIVVAGERSDVLIAAVDHHEHTERLAGVVVCGRPPHRGILALARKAGLAVLSVPGETYAVASSIEHMPVRIEPGDRTKIDRALALVRSRVDTAAVLAALEAAGGAA